jgi:mono/diheme cytochrome c family protein
MPRIPRSFIAVVVLLAGTLLGLADSSRVPAAETSGKSKKFEIEIGQKVFAQYCAHCHGAEGKGDGISGQNLPVKPQDLTEGRVINPLPDHFLHRVISEGGQAVGLSPLMPGFRPQLSDVQIRNAIAYIRTLAKPEFKPQDVLPVAKERKGPVQPIFFSHVIHAGSFQIDCQYCHAGARRSSAAGLPSVERCMGCHKIIAAQGNPEVQKLHGYWERKEPIPWVRIFKLPEHAKFPHKNHVQAGLPCQTCHGRIEAMEQVHAETGQNIVNDLKNLAGMPTPPPRLTMGWCVECHRAANDNNLASLSWIEAPAPQLAERVHLGHGHALPKAPLDCVACHH